MFIHLTKPSSQKHIHKNHQLYAGTLEELSKRILIKYELIKPNWKNQVNWKSWLGAGWSTQSRSSIEKK